jgi:anti-sigma B factor antagonist
VSHVELTIVNDDELDLPVLHVSGELDLATSGRMLDEAAGLDPILLDLSAVTFMDSTGVDALIRLRRLAAERDSELRLVASSRAVQGVLTASGLKALLGRRQ